MAETLRIPRRFHGPPASGNGGYVAGCLAAFLPGPAAVRLERPPPLEADLEVRREPGGVRLLHEGTPLAAARPAVVDVPVPDAPSPDQSELASRRFRAFEEHPFETCFVCGPRRTEGDGLRIFPGPVSGDAALVASPWTPAASLGDAQGRVRPEFVWAALDCPGAFAFPQPAGVALLGELAVDIAARPRVGERCVVIGFELAHEGRKHVTGTALFDAAGRRLATARGVWIELARAPGAA